MTSTAKLKPLDLTDYSFIADHPVFGVSMCTSVTGVSQPHSQPNVPQVVAERLRLRHKLKLTNALASASGQPTQRKEAMKNIPVILRKRPLRTHSNSDPPLVKSPAGRVVLGLPVRRVPVVSFEQEPYIDPYRHDPAKVLEMKQFIEFGCGACHHHRPKADRSGYHCAAAVKLWPEGTNKTCAAFMRRIKRKSSSKRDGGG